MAVAVATGCPSPETNTTRSNMNGNMMSNSNMMNNSNMTGNSMSRSDNPIGRRRADVCQ
ncbi:MAG: hypothetical protein ACR2MG_13165 [Pyrinomonadaceae bacterium]